MLVPDVVCISVKAKLRVCADGGANRWFDIVSKLSPNPTAAGTREKLPDLIRGDLDSLRDDVRKFYEERGVKVDDLSEDQDSTDLTKAVNYVDKKLQEMGATEDVVIVVSGLYLTHCELT